MIHDLRDTLGKGGIGMMGAAVSKLMAVAAWQEQAAWIGGMLVTAASFTSICIGIVKKLKEK